MDSSLSAVGVCINHTSHFLYPNISMLFSGEFNISHFRAPFAFHRSSDQSLSMIQLIVTHRPRDESSNDRRRYATTKKISNEAPSLVLTDARDIRMYFVCSSFLGRPTSLRSSIIVSPFFSSLFAFSSYRPPSLRLPFLSAFFDPFLWLSTLPRAYTYFLSRHCLA